MTNIMYDPLEREISHLKIHMLYLEVLTGHSFVRATKFNIKKKGAGSVRKLQTSSVGIK